MKRKPYVDHEKQRQRRVLFFGLFMVVVMLGSTFAYYIVDSGNSENRLEYGEYEFTYKDLGDGNGVLVTEISGQEVEFQSLPVQVGYLDVDPQAIELLRGGQQVVLATGTNLTPQDAMTIDYARLQLGLAIPKAVNAITQEDERYTQPVVNCSMASPQMPVVIFNVTNETSLKAQGSCIVLSGENVDLLRMKDRIIFEYIGILSNGTVVED